MWHPPPQEEQSGRTSEWSWACAAATARCTRARSCFASGSVRPRFAISPRSRGRLISSTSTSSAGLSVPVSTNRKTHPTLHPPSHLLSYRSYLFHPHTPTFSTLPTFHYCQFKTDGPFPDPFPM